MQSAKLSPQANSRRLGPSVVFRSRWEESWNQGSRRHSSQFRQQGQCEAHNLSVLAPHDSVT
eukprot:2130378-Rhodomonas_salina.1